MPFTKHNVDVIRSLAKRVAESAALPVQEERRDGWTRLNRLERVRPLIHVQADWTGRWTWSVRSPTCAACP